jgi:hypothetical protein
MAAENHPQQMEFEHGRLLVEEAYTAYREGRMRAGFFKLDELQKLLQASR